MNMPVKALSNQRVAAIPRGDLLTPTRIYKTGPELLSEVDAHGMAHITGGGIVENLGRILPEGLGAVIDTPAIEVPAIFALISSWQGKRKKCIVLIWESVYLV